MKWLTGLLKFLQEFIIGDDWKIAAGVVLALAITGGIMAGVHGSGGSLTPWTLLGAVLILGLFVVVLLIDLRPRRGR